MKEDDFCSRIPLPCFFLGGGYISISERIPVRVHVHNDVLVHIQYIAMSEFPKVCNCSSTQAISPQCLNVFISNLVYRFLKGLGIFPCTTSTSLKISASIRTTHNFLSHLATFLEIVEVLRHSVMLLTATLIFNKAQPVLYTRVVAQWDGTGF